MSSPLFTKLAELEGAKKRGARFAYFLSNPENIGYLSRFWGSFGRILVTKKETVLISDARYAEKAKQIARHQKMEFLLVENIPDFWEKMCRRFHITELGFEATETSVAARESFQKKVGARVKLVPTLRLVEQARLQKTPKEIAIMQKAAQITDATLQKLLSYIKTGVTEKKIAWILEKIAREEFGATGMSFAPIIAFGPNSAIPHHESTDLKLKKNMPLLIDCGVRFEHYCSDMTRCFFFGKPTAEWLRAYLLVLAAQEAGIAEIREGAELATPMRAARAMFGTQAEFFTHSFGHGVGLDIHEAPAISDPVRGKFQTNMVVTAEPGLYFSGKFGIRIEDLLVVREKTPRLLSTFPKDPATTILG